MRIETDDRSGFCFGVRNAVEVAEESLRAGEEVCSLGQIVHNDLEVERLQRLGLITINHDQFRTLRDSRVLIRAHGEPPDTYRIAKENNITLIEATCPIVKRLQQKIMDVWKETGQKGGSLVIFGKKGHAEVIGLMGQTDNKAILTDGESDLDRIDYTREVHLFAQTTMSYSGYERLAEKIRERMTMAGIRDPDSLLSVHNTICSQVGSRQASLEKFAARHDIIIFVSGRESSNGKQLFETCRKVNPDSHFVSSPSEINTGWFRGKKSAGICGATSTPLWLIQEIRQKIESIDFSIPVA